MALSTSDCKKFLAEHADDVGVGPWKRVNKRNVQDGVQRIFSSADGERFVALLEKDGMLSLGPVGNSLQAVDEKAPERFLFDLHDMFPPDYAMSDADVEHELKYLGADWEGQDPRLVFRQWWDYSLIAQLEGPGEDGKWAPDQDDDEDTALFGRRGANGFMLGYHICGCMDDQHNTAIGEMVEHIFNDFPGVGSQEAESVHSVQATPKQIYKRLVNELRMPWFDEDGVDTEDPEERKRARDASKKLPRAVRLPLSHAVFNPRQMSVTDSSLMEATVQRSRLSPPQIMFLNWAGISADHQLELKRWALNQGWQLSQMMTISERMARVADWHADHANHVFSGVAVAKNGVLLTTYQVQQFLAGTEAWLDWQAGCVEPVPPMASTPKRRNPFG